MGHERRTVGRRAARALVLLVAVVMSISVAGPGSAGGRYRIESRRIAPGLRFIEMIDRKVANRIHVLRLDPDTRLSLDVALANDKIPEHERTSMMAQRHDALAAINGDYTITPGHAGAGRPVNIFARDGRLETSSLIWGHNFAIARDEGDVHVGHTSLSVRLRDATGSNTWGVRAWNDLRPLPDGKLAAYTADAGPDFAPPKRACSARIYPSGSLRWAKDRMGLVREFDVDRVECAYERLARRGGTVVAVARTSAEGESLSAALTPGDRASLRWSIGWPGVMDTIGGNPTLLEDGRISLGECGESYFCDRNPRTGIGVTPTGKVLLVTVDGRRPGYSVGLHLPGFARLFKRLGATWALNLDGGGSTTMVVGDRVVNRPSDLSGERAVGSAVLILPGPDAGEGEPAPAGSAEVTSLDTASTSARLTAVDPGSTGGMLDALARGDIAPVRDVPSALRPSLAAYRHAWREGRIPPGLGIDRPPRR